MDKFHGTTINFKDINTKFPSREQFLNKKLVQDDKERLNTSQPILFLPNDITEKNMKVDGCYKYTLLLAGILPSGLKTVISLLIQPYFYVRVPDDYLGLDVLANNIPSGSYDKCENFKNELQSIFQTHKIYTAKDWVLERKFGSTEFQRIKGFYWKVPFNTLGQRRNAINLISLEANKQNKFKTKQVMGFYCHTAVDDLTCYYRVACRDYRIDLCGWNEFTKYNICSKDTVFGQFNGDAYLHGDISHFKKYTNRDRPELKRDNSIIISWDIECNRGANDGDMPDGEEPTDEVFMIGMTVGFYHDKTLPLRYCITSRKTNNSNGDLTIQCADQKELLKAFAITIGKIHPEFIAGFNDGNFDWPFVVEKANSYLLLEYFKQHMSLIYMQTEINPRDISSIKKFNRLTREPNQRELLEYINTRMMGTAHRERIERSERKRGYEFEHQKTKLDPDTNADTYSLKFFGYIPLDVRCVFRSIYKNPEVSNLNYFLKDNNLDPKDDMPIVELFEIYDRMQLAINANDKDAIAIEADNMRRVKEYCVYDAEACHHLLLKRNVVMDKRNISSLAYTSMHDALYRADGMKVRNYVTSDAALRGIMYSNITQFKDSDAKYPGAYVVPPTKGMQISKLSIRERKNAAEKKAKHPYHTPNTDLDEYLNLSESAIAEMENLILMLNYKNYIFKNLLDDDIYQCVSAKLTKAYSKECQLNDLREMATTTKLSDDEAQLLLKFWEDPTGRPVSGLDFSSLYPSIMMAYNLSKETMIRPDYDDTQGFSKFEQKADRLRKLGYKLQYIEFPYGIEGQSRTIKGYSVRHKYDPNGTTSPEDGGFGVFPTILYFLFNERKKIKKKMTSAGKIIEETEKEVEPYLIEIADENTSEQRRCELQQLVDEKLLSPEFKDVQFDFTYYQSAQLALKVFMNTFYGESGNKLSPLFMLELSGGITTMGQYNIKKVISHTQSLDCEVVYGDTDSAYIKCPESIYSTLDILYYGNKIDKLSYWTKTVENTFECIEIINTDVNKMLIADNGTKFLKTAYEEVLYPVAFLSKKKYYGIPHEEIVNFFPKNMFIRGLDLKKRGVPDILKKVCSDIMWKSLRATEFRSLMHLVEDAIGEVYNTKWAVSDFIKTASYKPNKKNVAVHTFVRRMREERDIVIKPVERFKYVYIKKNPFRFATNGKSIKLQAGDIMELVEIAEKENMTIDLDKYVNGQLKGQFARLIVYNSMFNVSYKLIDASVDMLETEYYSNAVDYVEQQCLRYQGSVKNPHTVHKRAYRSADYKLKAMMPAIKGSNALKYICSDVVYNSGLGEYFNSMYETINAETKQDSILYADNVIKRLLKFRTIGQIYKIYFGPQGYISQRLTIINKDIENIKQQLENIINDNQHLITFNQRSLDQIITEFRQLSELDPNDEDYIDKLTSYLSEQGTVVMDEKINTILDEMSTYEDVMCIINDHVERIRIQFRLKNEMCELKLRIQDKLQAGTIFRPSGINLDLSEFNLDDVDLIN